MTSLKPGQQVEVSMRHESHVNWKSGRAILLWATILFSLAAFNEFFSDFYQAWLIFPYIPPGWDISRAIYGFWPRILAEGALVGVAVFMAIWQIRYRSVPATEATFLFWTGLGLAAWTGRELVNVIVFLPFASDTPEPSVPHAVRLVLLIAVGVAMMVVSLRLSRTQNARPIATPA